jgi:hypothetical protein
VPVLIHSKEFRLLYTAPTELLIQAVAVALQADTIIRPPGHHGTRSLLPLVQADLE